MGTPEFAVPSLQILVENGCQVVAVVTAPDKPQGRGKQLGISAVKAYALTASLPVLQPVNLKDPAFASELRGFAADVQVIVAFRMLPEAIWNMPPLGSYNLHGSLLPDYRGAAPINWAIINGEKVTGVTTFKLKHEIDTGNILFQEQEPISENDTVGDVYARLMKKGAKLVLKTIQALEAGEVELKPQTIVGEPKNAPKIFRETCQINWQEPAVKIRNLIRGLSPYPAAWTTFEGKNLKIYKAEIKASHSKSAHGTLHSDWKTYLHVQTGNDQLALTEIQLEGKKRMEIGEFLRGLSTKPTTL